MKRHANLMSDTARFRVTARILLRRWAIALAATVTLLAPITVWRWQESRRTRLEYEALEASYAPIRRLDEMNMELRNAAAALVRDERLTLELSRRRPATTLLSVVSAAAASTNGSVYIQSLKLSQSPPGAPATSAGQDVLTVEAACPPQFDIATLVDALKQPPFTEAKIVSDDLSSAAGVDRKTYTIECRMTLPAKENASAK